MIVYVRTYVRDRPIVCLAAGGRGGGGAVSTVSSVHHSADGSDRIGSDPDSDPARLLCTSGERRLFVIMVRYGTGIVCATLSYQVTLSCDMT